MKLIQNSDTKESKKGMKVKLKNSLDEYHQTIISNKQSYGLVIIWTLAFLFLSSNVYLLCQKIKLNNANAMLLTELAITVVPIILDIFYIRYSNKSKNKSAKNKINVLSYIKNWIAYFTKAIKKHWQFLVIATLIAVVIEIITSIISIKLFGKVTTKNTNTNLIMQTIKAQPLFILATLILAPVSEEITFRLGLTYVINSIFNLSKNVKSKLWLQKFAFVGACFISACIFGSLHVQPDNNMQIMSQVLPLAALGLWLQYLQVKTKSIIPGIIIHILYNLITLFFVL